MTYTTLRTLALAGVLATIVPYKGMAAESPAHFNVPFDFAVGNKSMAAGPYSVLQIAPNVLNFQSMANNNAVMNIVVHPDSAKTRSTKTTLVFHRYGNQYFFNSLTRNDRGWEAAMPKHERELVAARKVREPQTLLASSLK